MMLAVNRVNFLGGGDSREDKRFKLVTRVQSRIEIAKKTMGRRNCKLMSLGDGDSREN